MIARPPLAAFAGASALAFAVILAPVLARAGTLQDLATKTKPSVVLLVISDANGTEIGSGTGFFVSADGKIVTNQHVVAPASKMTANLSDGRKIEVSGVFVADEEKDLAIVKIPGDGYPALTLGESKSLRAGDDIIVIGSPLGLSGTVSAGIVSAIREDNVALATPLKDKPKAWSIQVSAAISPGSSGSPIMTPGGSVVAVAVGRLNGGENLNFGIPIENAEALLSGIKDGAVPMSLPVGGAGKSRSSVTRNIIASAIFFSALVVVWFAITKISARRGRVKKAREEKPRLLS